MTWMQYEHGTVIAWLRSKGRDRHMQADPDPAVPWRVGEVAVDLPARQHQLCRPQYRARCGEPTDQGGGNPVRRIGHHVERPGRQRHRHHVGLDDGGSLAQSGPQCGRPPGVQFDGQYLLASPDQREAECSPPSTEVEHEVTGRQPCRGDDALGPTTSQLMGAPPLRWGRSSFRCGRGRPPPGPGHDAPSP